MGEKLAQKILDRIDLLEKNVQKDVNDLKNQVNYLNERIDAVLMDVETVDSKTDNLKRA